ncbi:MAG TPA: DUF4118 domain-containing protein [Alphaproteobacteria bacterium]|nr:DUF4118 domain-containing protein [Alphaproteobacteria bacterium]
MKIRAAALSRDRILGYAVAVVAPVATTAFRLWVGDWLIGVPFILLFPSVTLAAYLGGFGPGLLALAMSVLLSVFALIEPRWSFDLAPGQVSSVAVFALVGGFQVWLVEKLRRVLEENRAGHERERLLRRELQHRVANLLQLIISMTALQSRGEGDPAARAALSAIGRRVQLLSEVNRHLQPSEPRSDATMLKEVTQGLLDVSGASGVSCRFDVAEDLILPESHRQPVALIVSELAMNAVKHAFAAGAGGRIDFRLARGEPGWAELRYGDDGAPFPAGFSPERSARSGLKLVDALARQLGGGLTIEAGPPKSVSIRFPVA